MKIPGFIDKHKRLPREDEPAAQENLREEMTSPWEGDN
jgi:hypothetical protein